MGTPACLESSEDDTDSQVKARNPAPKGSISGQFRRGADPRRHRGRAVSLKAVPMKIVTRPTGELARLMMPQDHQLRPDPSRPGPADAIRSMSNLQVDMVSTTLDNSRQTAGSRVVDVNALNAAYTLAAREHEQYIARTRRVAHPPAFSWGNETRKLLATSVSLVCDHPRCNFQTSPLKLYTEQVTPGQGPKFACVNTAVATHAVLTKATSDDILDLFASVGVPMPENGHRTLTKIINRVCDVIVELNQEVIAENKDLTEMVARLRDPQRGSDSLRMVVDFMLDGHYDVSTKGRSYSCPASMCDVVALERTTAMSLPLAYEVYSKFGGRTRGAREAPTSIANSEQQGMKDFVHDLQDGGKLQAGACLRDGDAKISSAKNAACDEIGIENKADDACVIHLNRCLPNRLWTLVTKGKLSKTFRTAKANPDLYPDTHPSGWTTAQKYQQMRTHAIDAFRRRSVAEFARAHEECTAAHTDDANFLHALTTMCRRAAKAIVLCFTGDHSKCTKWSRVCQAADNEYYVPTHLPNGEYLPLTKNDKKLVYECLLQAKLGDKMVQLQRKNLNTNTAESRWKSSDKGNQKGVTNIRNHVAKSTSNYLKHSVGRGNDIVLIAQATGIGLTPALLHRATRKRKQYAQETTQEALKKRRFRKFKKKQIRRPISKTKGEAATVAYVGGSADFMC